MFLTSRKYRRLAALISFAVFILVYRYLQHAAHGPAFSVASVVPRLGQEKPAPSASFAAKLSPPNKVAHIQYDESDDDSNANVVDSDSEEALVRADNHGNHNHPNPNQQKKPSHLSNSDSSSGGSILGRLSSESNLSRPFHIGPILQNSGAIPRLILHIHSTADREQIQYEVQSGLDHKDRYNWFKSWESVNPTHIQILFEDKKDSLRLIKGSYGWEVSSTYYKLPYVRQRREYTQFLMLRHFGGVFADMRTTCTTPVDKWDLGRKRIRFIVGLDVSLLLPLDFCH
ncbi:hypothetical protein BCR33DRAFT_445807 [Rhizoclosmatium globosum]|uniref:Uncharacterized protein n=1 Tax=Rhizoclosmatium globosum TaxID=329046 RepID=A0A1Y2BSQ2_9FUNG|nr:hypothetical protein BCR33DRAFT_445807 [Rhizoclosmatium globosum]|eukprot:ORY37773.1 hypothetical protein BCR33DRAFT_445807 [Rhizoclosmatium globosum]